MKKFVLIALVLTISAVLYISQQYKRHLCGDPTPNAGWNSWVPQYQASTASQQPNSFVPDRSATAARPMRRLEFLTRHFIGWTLRFRLSTSHHALV